MIVYKLTNLVNGKIYVGQTTRSLEKRFKEHSHCKTSLIGQAIHEFGEENFSREVLATCDSKEETDNLEVFFICYFNCRVPNGYNVAEGGSYNPHLKKSPFSKWVQMNYDENAYQADDWLVANSPAAYRIFKFLIANMDNYNAVICPYEIMQEKFGYSKATIERAIKVLKEHQYVGIAKSGTSNVYLINKHLYWNSWGTNYAYAEFDARVIISVSEQDKETQSKVRTELKKRQEVVVKQPTFREKIEEEEEEPES